jgi:hypothetical protein
MAIAFNGYPNLPSFVVTVWSGKETESARMKYWEIIADKSQRDRVELGLCCNDGCTAIPATRSAVPSLQ